MNLTHKEYELIIEKLTIALNVAERNVAILEDGGRQAQKEIERLREENRELRQAAQVADAEALLLKKELDEIAARRSEAAKKANAARRRKS